ncbi:MAG: L,D-transpeptidase [Hyphomicrobiales bacterium]|nr:L,D-transpeptidase [Hyphomicrobiales bacterium]
MNRRDFTLQAYAGIGLLFLPAGHRAAWAKPPAVRRHDTDDRFPIDHAEVEKIDPLFRRAEIAYETVEQPGTLIVDPGSKYLYLILERGRALRYGVGVGRQGFEWSGEATVRRKAKWPSWTPPKSMVERDPLAAKWADGMPGGPDNPLGARALYLYQGEIDTLYRIHGTNQPQSIGKAVSSGCIRLVNADIADLYSRVRIGAKVIVLPALPPHPGLEWPPSTGLQSGDDGLGLKSLY